MDIRTITRTAAIVYADSTMNNRTTNTIKRKFIESAYVNNNNAQMTLYELANRIHEEMGLLFSEDEIKPIVKDSEITNEQIEFFVAGIKTLIPTEKAIFEAHLNRITTKEIMSSFNITENTLKFHNKNIYGKLGVSSKKQLLEINKYI